MLLTSPTIHKNGTSQQDLASAASDAKWAVQEALRQFALVAPNGRDYPNRDHAFNHAMTVHAEYRARLEAVQGYLEALQEDIADGGFSAEKLLHENVMTDWGRGRVASIQDVQMKIDIGTGKFISRTPEQLCMRLH